MLILAKSCRLLHDSYLKLFKPILLSLMTHQSFWAGMSVSYLHNDFSVREHSANASAASSDDLCFNASWHFRNRRWHRFFSQMANKWVFSRALKTLSRTEVHVVWQLCCQTLHSLCFSPALRTWLLSDRWRSKPAATKTPEKFFLFIYSRQKQLFFPPKTKNCFPLTNWDPRETLIWNYNFNYSLILNNSLYFSKLRTSSLSPVLI